MLNNKMGRPKGSKTQKELHVYNLGNLTQEQLFTFKDEICNHNIHSALNIKNLNFTVEEVEGIVRNAVNHVILIYNPKSGNNLGDLVKSQVFADLRAEFEKRYPNRVNRVKWPDLSEKRASKKLLETVSKLKNQPVALLSVNMEVNKNLSGRQKKLLNLVSTMEISITFKEIAGQFNVTPAIITREMKVIYSQLLHAIKLLGIQI